MINNSEVLRGKILGLEPGSAYNPKDTLDTLLKLKRKGLLNRTPETHPLRSKVVDGILDILDMLD